VKVPRANQSLQVVATISNISGTRTSTYFKPIEGHEGRVG
jgi:hypothetical protein